MEEQIKIKPGKDNKIFMSLMIIIFGIMIVVIADTFRLDTLLVHKLHCRFVTFRVNAGCVKRIVAALNTKETCTLLEGFCSQLVNVQQLLAVGKASVLFAVIYDVFGNCAADT